MRDTDAPARPRTEPTGDLSASLGLGAPTAPNAAEPVRETTDRRPAERRFDDRRADRPSYDRPSYDRRPDDRRTDGPRDRGSRDGGFQRDARTPREPDFGSRRRVEDIGEAWPEIPEWATADELDPEVRRDLRGLSREGADFVAAHLVAASALADEEPDLAWRHARAARTRGGRIAVVRETVGLVAYRAGEWAEAIGELRAARRMSGGPGQLAVLADCERALGHPERAIELSRSAEAAALDPEQTIELGIVSAGARADLGQVDAAVAQLAQLAATAGDSPRVAFAYADLLEQVGRREDAIRWFIKAADADLDEETDAGERLQQLGADPERGVAAETDGDPVETSSPAIEDVDDDVATEPTAQDDDAVDTDAATSTDGAGPTDTVTEVDDTVTEVDDSATEEQPAADEAPAEVTVVADRQGADAPDVEGEPGVDEEEAGRPPFVEAVATEVSEPNAAEQPSAGEDTDGSASDTAAGDPATAQSPAAAEGSTDDGSSGESSPASFPGAPLFSDNPRTGA